MKRSFQHLDFLNIYDCFKKNAFKISLHNFSALKTKMNLLFDKLL